MRIISNFHDYYDSVQKMGQDRSLIYQRTTKTLEVDTDPMLLRHPPTWRSGWMHPFDIRQWTIGFCGHLYPIFHISLKPWNFYSQSSSYDTDIKWQVCCNIKQIDEFVESNFRGKDIDIYQGKNKNYRNRWDHHCTRKQFDQFFESFNNIEYRYSHLFVDNHAPVFYAERKTRSPITITINPELKSIEFFRIRDAYSTFQDIAMYLGGMANPAPRIPAVSNDDLIEAKGFDKRFSFRKEKAT